MLMEIYLIKILDTSSHLTKFEESKQIWLVAVNQSKTFKCFNKQGFFGRTVLNLQKRTMV